jgi:hypothetical protein
MHILRGKVYVDTSTLFKCIIDFILGGIFLGDYLFYSTITIQILIRKPFLETKMKNCFFGDAFDKVYAK